LKKNKSINKMIKKIAIKRIRTKFDIKIKWKQILRDWIEKQSINKMLQNKIKSNSKNDDQI
jgi:hypothetical protein